MSRPPASQRICWPARRFYWAVLDTTGFPRAGTARGPSTRQLGYVFENVLPGVQIEHVHAVYRRLPAQGRVLACGVPAETLKPLADHAVTLTPESLPPFVTEEVDPASLNLLTGRFLPPAIRRRRHRWFGQVAMIVATCAALLVWGMERRTSALRHQRHDVSEARTQVFGQVLGSGWGQAASGGQPPELRLAAEVRRLEQTRQGDHDMTELSDCSLLLAKVLSHWPAAVRARTESVSVTEAAVTIRANVASMADAQQFANAFAGLPGWRLKQPRSEVRRDHVVVTMRLEPEQGSLP